jgi:hypothetical protein
LLSVAHLLAIVVRRRKSVLRLPRA